MRRYAVLSMVFMFFVSTTVVNAMMRRRFPYIENFWSQRLRLFTLSSMQPSLFFRYSKEGNRLDFLIDEKMPQTFLKFLSDIPADTHNSSICLQYITQKEHIQLLEYLKKNPQNFVLGKQSCFFIAPLGGSFSSVEDRKQLLELCNWYEDKIIKKFDSLNKSALNGFVVQGYIVGLGIFIVWFIKSELERIVETEH